MCGATELDAQPSADYEFSPSMTEDKQRERASRPAIIDGDRARPGGARSGDSARSAERTIEKPETPTLPSIASITPPAAPSHPAGAPSSPPASPPGPATAAPAIAQPATPPPGALPSPRGPVLVAPTDVTRLGGITPTVNKSKRGEVPPVVSAKVCIDPAGRVSSVDVLTKLERMTVIDLTDALESWTLRALQAARRAGPGVLRRQLPREVAPRVERYDFSATTTPVNMSMPHANVDLAVLRHGDRDLDRLALRQRDELAVRRLELARGTRRRRCA